MKRFKSPRQAQRFLSTHDQVANVRSRRLAKDFENLAETLATFVTLAPIQPALRRLARA